MAVALLLAIGVVMVYSASSVKALEQFGDSFYFLKRQILWALIGLIAMSIISNFDYWLIDKLSNVIFGAALLMLVLVLIPGIGRESHGAQRWLGFGFASFQPSEVMKLAFVVFLAHYIAAHGEKLRLFWRGLIPPILITGLLFLLILRQPDLGTAISIAATAVILLFVGGSRLHHLGLVAALSVPVGWWAVMGEEYRVRRITSFLNPGADPSGAGYQIIQSLYAIGSGGLFGVGLGRGRQKFWYLPEQHTDFIFAVIGEELGFIGSFFIIILFFIIAWRGYKIAMESPDLFSSLLACGVTTMIVLQAIVNIAVVTSILPITGIPLPFLSFGGSSLVFTLMGVGMLLNVSKYAG